MDREQAKLILDQALEFSSRLNWGLWWVRELFGENDGFIQVRRATGNVMGEMYFCILRPIEAAFPEFGAKIYEESDQQSCVRSDPADRNELVQYCIASVAELESWLRSSETSPRGALDGLFVQIEKYRNSVEALAA